MARREISLVAFAGALAVFAAVPGSAGTMCESGRITTPGGAFCAAGPWLPTYADDWHVDRIVLAEQAAEYDAVVPDSSSGGLTRKGFPGPVWAVIVSASLRCGPVPPRPTRLLYVFEASNGRRLIVSGVRCAPPGSGPSYAHPREAVEEGELRIRRGAAFDRAFGALTGTYPPGYLEQLDADDERR